MSRAGRVPWPGAALRDPAPAEPIIRELTADERATYADTEACRRVPLEPLHFRVEGGQVVLVLGPVRPVAPVLPFRRPPT